MALADQPVEEFLAALASKAAAPGGGSAAALMGALGAALVAMVCNLTVGRKKYAEVDAEMREVLGRAEAALARLSAAMDQDVEAFQAVMAARDEATLRRAAEVPLECARVCAEVIELARAALRGNPNVVSDAGVAAVAAGAALRASALNVRVNVRELADRGYAEAALREVEALVGAAADAGVYAAVQERLK